MVRGEGASAGSQSGFREWYKRNHDHDEMPRLVKHVLYDERWHDADPYLGRLEIQIAERLAELGIDLQAMIDLLDGGKNLRAAAVTACRGDEHTHGLQHPLRIDDTVGGGIGG